jgi:hypothetical protein
MRRNLISIIAIAAILWAAADAPGAGRRFAARASTGGQPTATSSQQGVASGQNGPVWVQPGGGPYRYNPYYQYKAMYPKYYWGMHARNYETIGIPHGDIGIRGNSITPLPW